MKIIFKSLIMGLLLCKASNVIAFDDSNLINPEYRFFDLKAQLELYTSDESKLYEYYSPHGKTYSPEGWGHSETVTIDLRRLKKDLLIMDYIPFYLEGKFTTYPYNITYADSLQIIAITGQLILPIIPQLLYVDGFISSQSWSGDQVGFYGVKGIFQTSFGLNVEESKNNISKMFKLLNVTYMYKKNSLNSSLNYIDTDGSKMGFANSFISGDCIIDTRAIGSHYYFGYKFDYTYNTDFSLNTVFTPNASMFLDKNFILQTILIGQDFRFNDNLGLIIENNFSWKENIRIFKFITYLELKTDF